MRQEARVHHHTPRFYLAGWCVDGKLTRYERIRGRITQTWCAPKATGFEVDLYSLADDLPEGRDALERFLSSRIDAPASQVLPKILSGEELSAESRAAWALFLLALRARSPEATAHVRREGVETLRQALGDRPQEYEALRQSGDPPTLSEWVNANHPTLMTNFGISQLPRIIGDPRYIQALLEMPTWTVRLDQSDVDFVTSDRPIVIVGELGMPDYAWLVSLNPRVAQIICRENPGLSRLQAFSSSEFAKWFNARLIERAAKYVYAAGPQHLAEVERWLTNSAAPPASS